MSGMAARHSIGRVVEHPEAPEPDRLLRPARLITLIALVGVLLTSVIMPGVGLRYEDSALWIALGVLGIAAFTAAQAGALYTAVTPWMTAAGRRRLLTAFAAAALLSVPLIAPVGADEWATWAWVGGSIAGTAPMVLRRWTAAAAIAASFAATVAVASWTGGSPSYYAFTTLWIGITIVAMYAVPVRLWDLLVQARQGRAAHARLAAAEERLRFARDVHDLLGHNLSVIALKAELAARLAPVDAARASQEAGEAQRLAASALTEMREVVDGYRDVDLDGQLSAIEQVLRSSGVRCTVTQPPEELPAGIGGQLVPVLREATTNVLRHSRAAWCTIEIVQDGSEVRMTVANDGAGHARPDRHSFGLRGLADRLAEAGGTLRTSAEGGVFTLDATVRAAA